ncbi:MAG: PorT family protein [Chloroflexia bacterium]|nr:PorT family protein [Chloroflexia bacterium]
MKQILTILILGVIAIGNIYSQENRKVYSQFDLGTTLSVPYKKTIEIWPEIEGRPQTDYGSGFGYFCELLASYNINQKYFIQTGLNYNLNRIDINDKVGLIENKGKVLTSYLNIPLYFGLKPIDGLPMSVSIGPYVGFILTAKEKGNSYIDTAGFVSMEPDPVLQSLEPKQDYDSDIKGDYTSIDFGLSLQLDYELKLSENLRGVILTRFNYGLTNVLTNDLMNNNSASNWKNYSLMIGFGLKL